MIACKTTIGFGAPDQGRHGRRRTASRSAPRRSPARARRSAGTIAPFEIPDDILGDWRAAGTRGARRARGVEEAPRRACRRQSAPSSSAAWRGKLPAGLEPAIADLKEKLAAEKPDGRDAQGERAGARRHQRRSCRRLILGSADLTPSNNTKTKNLTDITPGDFSAAATSTTASASTAWPRRMNGMALHGGFIPYGGTFLVFTDYARPAMRLAALTGIPVIYVMTHDSIGLGEDGPTHQPVEHLAALRAMPNMRVFRPADAIETAECWQLALERPTARRACSR